MWRGARPSAAPPAVLRTACFARLCQPPQPSVVAAAVAGVVAATVVAGLVAGVLVVVRPLVLVVVRVFCRVVGFVRVVVGVVGPASCPRLGVAARGPRLGVARSGV